MPDETDLDDGFDPLPAYSEPPEGSDELALQEQFAGTDARPAVSPTPPVVGRTYQLDVTTGRFVPAGYVPTSINGEAAMRQAIAKALATPRGSAAVQGDDYGRENADRDAEGQPFDSAAFAELEESVRDCLLSFPWVLAVEDFDVVEEPEEQSTTAVVSFRVVPEGDAEPVRFDAYPLPAA